MRSLWPAYSGWLAMLFPTLWEEVKEMGRRTNTHPGPLIDLRPVIEFLGLREVIEQAGVKRVVDAVGVKRVVEEVGVKHVLDEVGSERILAEMGIAGFLADLTPKQKRDILRHLRQGE